VPCDFAGEPFSPSANEDTPPALVHQDSSSSYVSSGSPGPSNSSSSIATPLYNTPMAMVRVGSNLVASRSLELKLLHHFTARTSQTFSDTEPQKLAWQIDIPELAYDAQYLMDAILAVSALHMRSVNPNDQSLIHASHGYMASALAQYSTLLNSGLSELNAEALFSTSALIAFQASASRRFDHENGAGQYALPLAWFHSFQGVKTVVMAAWPWLRTSDKVHPIINAQPALELILDPEHKMFFSPLLEGLGKHLESFPENSRNETQQAYEHAVAFINWAHAKPTRNRILGFAATVSRRYVELLCQHDPLAMVIAACFFALTKVVDNVWWLEGVAKREVNGILSLMPSEWWEKMEWPTRIANHEGPMDEATWGFDIFVNGLKLEEEEGPNNVHTHIDLLAQIMQINAPQPGPD
jgi:hypothetical protein